MVVRPGGIEFDCKSMNGSFVCAPTTTMPPPTASCCPPEDYGLHGGLGQTVPIHVEHVVLLCGQEYVDQLLMDALVIAQQDQLLKHFRVIVNLVLILKVLVVLRICQ
uniref:Uncharacterized protein n=1 Tax=Acrobeloides nanus TaxID=290746 RepID=A0A914E1L0_9BILA